MSEFHKEENHEPFALLFESHKIEDKFKSCDGMRYVVIKDKEENRIDAMLKSSSSCQNHAFSLQLSAISCVAFARTEMDAILKVSGLLPVIPSGMAICPACLEKAILACEENLAVLKDIKEATKGYVK